MKTKKVFEKQYVFKIKYVGTTKSVLKREKIKNILGRERLQGKSKFIGVIMITKMSRPI
jgi:hypothetical protein